MTTRAADSWRTSANEDFLVTAGEDLALGDGVFVGSNPPVAVLTLTSRNTIEQPGD